jgi:hypothetical protein
VLGDAEVEHLHGPVGPHLDIGGLQITMDDAVRVRGVERLDDLAGDGQRLGERERSADDAFGQRLALDQLEDDGRAGSGVLDAVDGGDARMVDGGEQPRLALEAGEAIRIAGERRRQHLDGHVAAQPRVAGAIHLANPARADEVADLVRANDGATRQGHGTCVRG